jgi:uncharacterized protein
VSSVAAPRVSLQTARMALLAAQGLLREPAGAASKADVLAAIRQMGVLQIDTIHIVARSPYFVLWSRLGDYPPVWLDELLAEGSLFEYWSHAACFLPIEQYPLYRRLMLDGIKGRRSTRDWLDEHEDDVTRLLRRIGESGAVRSADFARAGGKSSGWWDWKPEKQLLERLHTRGDLMIARRHNFQRIYDLRERVLVDWDDAETPSLDETLRTLTLQSVRALGVTKADWVADYVRLPKRPIAALVRTLAAEGALAELAVEGWSVPGYAHPDHLGLIERIAAGAASAERTVLLSPFDPIVWDRARALALFGFDYRLESYTPAQKRRYGYFTLPLLRRGALIGRVDAAALRKAGAFAVKALHLEADVVADELLATDIAAALRACAVWHRTPVVTLERAEPSSFAALLARALG